MEDSKLMTGDQLKVEVVDGEINVTPTIITPKKYKKLEEGKNMKVELTLVLKSSERAFETLQELKAEGFNGTVISSESLRHAVDYYPGEHHFFNLRHLEKMETLESVLCVFVIEEQSVNKLKNIIRKQTGNFSMIKGFMYSRPIDDYEGSI